MVRQEAICGAIGPQRGDVILRCTLLEEDHGSRHRHCRDHRDVKWAHEWRLETDENGLVGSYRPHGYTRPGPRPRGDGRETPMWGPGITSRSSTDVVDDTPDPIPEQHLAPASRPPELPLCPEVEELTEKMCRGWFPREHDELGEDVAHICHKHDDHPHDGRCECVCGRRRRAESYGPLDPTDRPEEELEVFT